MAFIVERDNKNLYYNFLKNYDHFDETNFKNYWVAQDLCDSYTEDEYMDFLKYYVGKRLFDKFVDEEGLMGDFEWFCNLYAEDELFIHGLVTLDEEYTTIFHYWLKEYILYWKDYLSEIRVPLRKSAILQMANRLCEMESPCLHTRTLCQLAKSIESILEKQPKVEQTKWCLLCSMDMDEMFFQSIQKICDCTLCNPSVVEGWTVDE